MAIVSDAGDHFALELAKACFAFIGKDLRYGLSDARDNLVVAVNEMPSHPLRHQRTDAAFSGSHKSGQD
jgi:hypothetical protein